MRDFDKMTLPKSDFQFRNENLGLWYVFLKVNFRIMTINGIIYNISFVVFTS